MLLGKLRSAGTNRHAYSPETNLERSEIAQPETATRSVDVAMYSFTDRELAEELPALDRKGVRVRVYQDREQSQQEPQREILTTASILSAAGIEVRVKGARDLMHLKSYAIDGRLLRTGSANWSPTGLKRQDKDVLYESSSEVVGRFEAKFEELWAKSTNTRYTSSARQLITCWRLVIEHFPQRRFIGTSQVAGWMISRIDAQPEGLLFERT